MPEVLSSPLSAWEGFYVMAGSAAVVLTGLQFVVMTLVLETDTPRTPLSIAVFGTPTIVPFTAVPLISAILSAPWPSN